MTPYQSTKGAVNIEDIVGVSGGQPTKGAVNIGDIVGISGGQTTKGAVNIGVIAGVSVSVAGGDSAVRGSQLVEVTGM